MNFNRVVNWVLLEMAMSGDDVVYLSNLLNISRVSSSEVNSHDRDDVLRYSKVLLSPNYNKALGNHFAQKTHFKFKVYVNDVSFEGQFFNKINHLIPTEPDHITLCIGLQSYGQADPLTPWMVGHRLGHHIPDSIVDELYAPTREYLLQHEDEIRRQYCKLASVRYQDFDEGYEYYNRQWQQLHVNEQPSNERSKKYFLYDEIFIVPLQPHGLSVWCDQNQYMPEEAFYDLLAQFLKFGKVTFRCPDVATGRSLAVKYEQAFNGYLQSLVGKITDISNQ